MEYFTFGPYLQRTRVQFVHELLSCRLALVLGDGDGRFIAKLLTANPAIRVDAVDLSAVMLRLLTERAMNVSSAKNRLRTIHTDALDFVANSRSLPDYDLVATHFFLDCLSEDEVLGLVSRLTPRLARNALWVVSDFAIPDRQPIGFASRIVVGALYRAFRLLTGIKTQALPDHSTALRRSGFILRNSKLHLGGMLVSELWIRKQ
jgi:SAM-dependent methyltransferase